MLQTKLWYQKRLFGLLRKREYVVVLWGRMIASVDGNMFAFGT